MGIFTRGIQLANIASMFLIFGKRSAAARVYSTEFGTSMQTACS